MKIVSLVFFILISVVGVGVAEGLYLGIDIGGTSAKMAVYDEDGKMVEGEKRVATGSECCPPVIMAQLVREAKKFQRWNEVKSVGVGMCATIDTTVGKVCVAPNMPKWNGSFVRHALEERFEKPVYLDNDANVAAIGAYCHVNDTSCVNMVCVTLGTGVGGGLIINGELYRGSTGKAGEIGHITINSNGYPCGCGNNGCVEAYIGQAAFMRYANQYLKLNPSKIIDKLMEEQGEKEVTSKILAQAAKEGDARAKELWSYYGTCLGIMLASVIETLDPNMIVLCGGVLKNDNLAFGSAMLREIKKRTYNNTFKIRFVQDEMGMKGAAMMAKKEIAKWKTKKTR
jgi:glucokinase